MIVIVMTYYQRQQQLNKTLASIRGDDFVVIIVDDCSPDPIEMPKVDYPVRVIRTADKRWTNPDPAYNVGLSAALKYNPDAVIIQNAECYHVGDILGYTRENLTNKNYIVFSAFSMDKSSGDLKQVIANNNHKVKGTGKLGWYNHPVHRPVALEFCAAISPSNLKILNGYDERLADGLSYGDTYFLHRIKAMGLTVEIPEHPFVVHQWHYSNKPPANASQLRHRNKMICRELIANSEIRAKHIYTEDLCES